MPTKSPKMTPTKTTKKTTRLKVSSTTATKASTPRKTKTTSMFAGQMSGVDPTPPPAVPVSNAPEWLDRNRYNGADKTRVTRVVFLADVSISMESLLRKLESVYNTMLDNFAREAAARGQSITVTLMDFSDTVNTVYVNRPVDRAPRLRNALNTRGTTALWSSAYAALDAISGPHGQTEDVAYLALILTDGADSTHNVTALQRLKIRMDAALATDNWTIQFFVPDQIPFLNNAQAALAGVRNVDNLVVPWSTSEKGLDEWQASVTRGMTSYLDARATGHRAVRSFIPKVNLDASKVDFSSLEPAKWVSAYQVPSGTRPRIDDFFMDRRTADLRARAERNLGIQMSAAFENGNGYYELTETVTVQPYKNVIVGRIDPKTGKTTYYTGANARALLGLPTDKDAKIKAGDLDGLKVWIQSTAPNRALLPGTIALYWTGKPN